RPKQVIQIKATPDQKDIVTKIEYDGFGRQVLDYLPVPTSQATGAYIDPTNITGAYYQTEYSEDTWYSEKTIENSPLNRVMSQAAPGDAWAKGAGHEIEFEYQTNDTKDVGIYWTDNGTIMKGSYNGKSFYDPNTLYKTVTQDENGHKIYEYKNKQGQVILKRTFVTSDSSAGRPDPGDPPLPFLQANTYYVYDIYGNLVAVIPPLASAKSNLSSTDQTNLCYTYKYDDRNRLIEKTLPGKEPEYM